MTARPVLPYFDCYCRVIVLILTMLIIVPLLTVSEADISLSLAVQFVHDLAVKNEKNPDTYQVSNP